MADPLSVLGLVGTCLTITARATTVGKDLSALRQRFHNVDRNLHMLSTQVSAIKTVTKRLENWLQNPSSTFSEEDDELRGELGEVLGACEVLLSSIHEQIAGVLSVPKGLSFWNAAKYLWGEDSTKECLMLLQGQVQALSTILQCFQLPCRAEQRTMLNNTETHSILDRAKDASSSLLWLRDSDSISERSSVYSEGSSKLSWQFSFDQEIIGSRAYRTLMDTAESEAPKEPLDQRSSSPVLVDSSLREDLRVSESIFYQPAERQRNPDKKAPSPLVPFWSFDSDQISLRLVPAKTERGSQIIRLYHAVRSMDLRLVAELMNEGADIHAQLDSKWTLWHVAARVNSCGPMIELLLANGANIDARNPQGKTVLHDACGHGRASLVKLLLARGADPEARQDSSGNCSLHAAVERDVGGLQDLSNTAMIVSMLLDAGVPADCRNKTRSTALDQIYLRIKTRESVLLSQLRRSTMFYSSLISGTSIAPQDQGSYSWLRNIYESYVGLMHVAQLLLDRGAQPSSWHETDFWGSRIEAIRQLGTIDGNMERTSRNICDWAIATLEPSGNRSLEGSKAQE